MRIRSWNLAHLAAALVALAAACSLSPQPLPPGETYDGGFPSPREPGGGNKTGLGENTGTSGEADATVDSSPAPYDGTDAAADAPGDAPADALTDVVDDGTEGGG